MKKLANPFDSFTAEHTPDDFAVCSWQAAAWLLPHLNYNDKSQCDFIGDCLAYSDFILKNNRQLTDIISAEERDTILSLQGKIANNFQKIWTDTVARELAAMAIKQGKAQSDRASKPRKIDSIEQWERIAKRYWEAKASGEGYGFTKLLAGEFGVTPQAIRNIANQRKPKTIAK